MNLIPNTFRPLARRTGAQNALRRIAASAASCLALTAALAAPVSAQDSRPDQVFVVNPRSGSVVANSGTVTGNGLDKVTLERSGGSEQNFKSERVRSVIFGDVPFSYREGILLRDRNDRFNAAAKFKLAAADEDARDVVRASARLLAAEMLLMHGAIDSSAYADADTAATRFIEEHSSNREMPRARFLQAQARLAQGQFASAAELFRTLFNETSGVDLTEGYDPYFCTMAGLRAADSFLLAKDTLAAREIYSALEAKLPGVIAALDEEDTARDKWTSAQSEARLGEGFVLLAAGSAGQARAFFEQQTTDSTSPAALRFGVRLGTGLVQLAEGNYRRAQFELATVSSIDHTDRNRAARALIGLAQSALNLPDSGGRKQAQSWLQSVLDHYPDTIWVHSAQELIQTL